MTRETLVWEDRDNDALGKFGNYYLRVNIDWAIKGDVNCDDWMYFCTMAGDNGEYVMGANPNPTASGKYIGGVKAKSLQEAKVKAIEDLLSVLCKSMAYDTELLLALIAVDREAINGRC